MHKTQTSHLIEYGLTHIGISNGTFGDLKIEKSLNLHTQHLKCVCYLDVIEANDASNDLLYFNRNDKNRIRINKYFLKVL